jgi:hypothetical protein
MSIANRIRLVGAVATSIAVALAVAVVFGVWVTMGNLPTTLSWGSAGALMGMIATTSLCLVVALSSESSERGLAGEPEVRQLLQPQTSYQCPPA